MDKKNRKLIPLGVTIGGFDINPPATNSSFESLEGVLGFIANLLSWFVGFAALVAVVMIVYGGFLLITAGGDPDKISNGQKAITAAIVGLIIVFLARTVVVFILQNFLMV